MKRVLIFCLCFLPVLLFAQTKLTGTAYDAEKRTKLKLVFVNNLTQKEVDHSGQKGDFEVKAELGDLIVFTCPGFESDTLIVENLSPKLVLLRPSLIVLDEVIVKAKATRSENFKESYASAYSAATTNVLSKDGNVSLYNLFSKESKQKRSFQKLINSELNEKLIDQKFNKELVADLTKLKGQLLEDFMSFFRPTYSEITVMDEVALRTYVVNSYNNYIKLPPESRIYPPLPKTSFSGL